MASTSQPATLGDDSFAALVPADVRAFVEVRGLAQLGAELLPGGLDEWTRLAAGQTSQPSVTVAWAQRVSRILGMSLAEATRNLFGQQVAIAAPSYDELAEGVVIARAPDGEAVAQLLSRNQARKLDPVGPVACYLLKEGLSLAVKERIVVLGQRTGKARLFDRTVALMAGEKDTPLRESPRFATQVRRLSPASQGVLYLDMPTTVAAAGADEPRLAPSLWSSFRRLTVGLYDRPGGLDLELCGLLDRPLVRGGLKDVSLEPVGRLPKSTLAVWAQTADLSGMYRQIMADRGPEQRTLRFNLEVVRALLDPIDLEKDLLDHLGPQVMIVCGCEPTSQQRGTDAYERPLVAVMIESRDVQATAKVLHRFVERFLGWMKVQLARAQRSLDLRVEETSHRQTIIHRISLDSLFARNTNCPYLKTLELCWAGVDGWLVVATHPDHIRQIIDARRASRSETFAATLAFASVQERKGISNLLLVRPADTARMLQSWLDYCRREAPQMFEPLWWKRMMIRRGGRRVALGIIIKEGAEPGRVVVGDPVLPEMPAAGRLKPGDKICAVDGRALSEEHPEDDLRDFVAMREDTGVVLRVERGGKLLDLRIPLSPPPQLPAVADVDPIGAIRHLIELGRSLEVGGFARSHGDAHHFNATVVLRMSRRPSK